MTYEPDDPKRNKEDNERRTRIADEHINAIFQDLGDYVIGYNEIERIHKKLEDFLDGE